jgi:DNA-binding NtrC family response regulator
MKKVLAVDDSSNTLKVIAAILKDDGFDVLQAQSGPDALDILQGTDDVDVVLSDLKMPGMDGLELYRNLCETGKTLPFIIMTAHGTVKSAVQALKEGITNYLIKPLDYEELVLILNRAIHEHEISQELTSLKKQIGKDRTFHDMIGDGSKMQEIFDMVRTVGPTDASVLIYGETGTGKELLARALHEESKQREKSMVCINSAALTEGLLEAELFGHVKGAFTGAVAEKKGRLETADGSTLFLDEIGQMSRRLQAKLLRFLEHMTFEPVGGTHSRRVDVRLLAATNLDLQKEIEEGRFLQDLLYRIDIVSIWLPPLRERMDSFPFLVDHFIRQYALQYEKEIKGAHPDVMNILMYYSWPGNIRELKNCIARAVILSKNALLMPGDLPEKIIAGTSPFSSRNKDGWVNELPEQGISLQAMEKELIQKTLEKCGGNKSLSAQYLGISRKALYQKLKRYKINAQ